MLQTRESFAAEPDITDLASEGQCTLHDFWRKLPVGTRAPHVRHWDPLALPSDVIPYLGLLKARGTPPVITVDLAGTAVVEAVGIDYTGVDITTAPGAEGAVKRISWMRDHAKPYLWEGPLTWSHRDYKRYSIFAVPFEHDDGEIVLIAQAYTFF